MHKQPLYSWGEHLSLCQGNVCYPATWVHFPTSSKANLLTPGRGEGECSFIVRQQDKENGGLLLWEGCQQSISLKETFNLTLGYS